MCLFVKHQPMIHRVLLNSEKVKSNFVIYKGTGLNSLSLSLSVCCCLLDVVTAGYSKEMRPPVEGEEQSSNNHAAQSSVQP